MTSVEAGHVSGPVGLGDDQCQRLPDRLFGQESQQSLSFRVPGRDVPG